MIMFMRKIILCLWVFLTALANAQSASASSSGYVGYNLTLEGDEDSVIFATDETRPNADVSDADVYLNASGKAEAFPNF